jgi:hypothetical protein
MFKNFSLTETPSQTDNLPQQVLKVLAGKVSNPATIKFINQLQLGKVLDAVFVGKLPEGKGVVSLGGHKVVVELPKKQIPDEPSQPKNIPRDALVKGQKMTVRVENSGDKPALKIIPNPSQEYRPKTPEVTTSFTSRGKTISRFSDLESPLPTSSDKITARVTSIVDSKTIMIEVGSKKFTVPVEKAENFKLGSQVSIAFEKTVGVNKPTLIESAAGNSKKLDFNTIKPYLPARMPVGEMVYQLKNKVLDSPVIPELQIKSDLMVRLRETLRLLTSNEGEIPDAKQVRQQVQSSGMNYEANVRQVLQNPVDTVARKELASDLKGLLLELYNSTEQASSKNLQKPSGPLLEFRNSIKYAVDNIELNQLSSQISKQENQPLVIQIPNPLSSGNKTIQLFVRDDSSEDGNGSKDKKKNHNVAFFLDLSFLGKIKINANIKDESLSVSIDVENEDVASFIRQKSDDFEKRMDEKEINASVECKVNHKVKPEKDSLIDLLVNHNTSLINIET